MTGGWLQLRSYRLAFELERRIHRIDRFRIPVPYGLALSAVGWWFAAVVAVLLAARVPVVGELLGLLPWPVRLVLLPAGIAHLLCALGPDGRPAYERAVARIRFAATAQRVVAFERRRPRVRERLWDVCVATDDRGTHLRPAIIRGGGSVFIARPARGRLRRSGVHLTAGEDRWLGQPRRLELPTGARLEIKCERR